MTTDPTLPFMRREAITLWRSGEQWTIPRIADALGIAAPTIAGWIASRGNFKPFNGRIDLSKGPAHDELRWTQGPYLRELESALRQTVIETLESEIAETVESIADLERDGQAEAADIRRDRLQAMNRRLESIRDIDDAETTLEE